MRAISAPSVAVEQQRAERNRQAGIISDRLRAALRALNPGMERLGRVIARENEGLSLRVLGATTRRRDIAATWSESLTLLPRSRHQVGLTIEVAWEIFETWDAHLVAGIYLQTGAHGSPEVFMLETRDTRLGTEHGRRTADALAQLVVDGFAGAATRYAELLDEAEARAQHNRQPRLESIGDTYIFRSEPDAGIVKILRRADGSVDGHAIAWTGAPLLELRAEGDRLFVRSDATQGWIERNASQQWVLTSAEPAGP